MKQSYERDEPERERQSEVVDCAERIATLKSQIEELRLRNASEEEIGALEQQLKEQEAIMEKLSE